MEHSTTKEKEPVKPKRTILKTILWIFIFLSTTIFAVPWLIDRFYKYWLGDSAWMTSSAFSCVPLLAFIIFFILEYVLFIEPEDTQDSAVSRKDFSSKNKAFMILIPLATAILLSVLSMFRFHKFSNTGVESVTLTNHTEYSWDDVEYFTLEDDWFGHLVFKVVFDDGSHAQFIGGATYYAWYTSKAFDLLYPDTDYDYARYLAKELCSRNIPAKIEDWDELIDDLRYDSHQEFAKELHEIISAESGSLTR